MPGAAGPNRSSRSAAFFAAICRRVCPALSQARSRSLTVRLSAGAGPSVSTPFRSTARSTVEFRPLRLVVDRIARPLCEESEGNKFPVDLAIALHDGERVPTAHDVHFVQ